MPLGPSWDIKPLPSHKPNPKRVPNVPLFDEVEEPDPGPPPIISPEVRDNPHPTDLEEGILEKLVKFGASQGNNFMDEDRIYLEQYMHPDRDIIPRQPLRPTKGMGMGPSDDLVYRRLPETRVGEHDYPMIDGLGGYTKSYGDKYNSKYDVWDFDTSSNILEGSGGGKSPLASAGNWIAKKVMQNVGTPFKVYERYPLDRFKEEEKEDGTGWLSPYQFYEQEEKKKKMKKGKK